MLFLPVMFFVGMVILSTMGRPIFFVQQRVGLNGAIFEIFKFRTMADTRNSEGALVSESLRVTRFGEFLRATSLDELPELWNVLRGDMSLVGPRPLLVEYLPLYSLDQAKRHDVRPGITGWAQVNGRNAISWEEKFDLDLWYIANRSLILDFKILCLTVLRIVQRRGINASDGSMVQKFTGTGKSKN
jgi:lipopolysaccharide/colanic/teichoic acid biosynthesis glycosyltransferase